VYAPHPSAENIAIDGRRTAGAEVDAYALADSGRRRRYRAQRGRAGRSDANVEAAARVSIAMVGKNIRCATTVP
jgi:hypothetical protein